MQQQSQNDPERRLREAIERGVIAPPIPPGVHLTDEQREELERQRRQYEEVLRQAEVFGIAQPDQRQVVEAKIAQEQDRIAQHPLSLVSLYDTLIRLQRWVFGLETRWSAILPSLIVTVLITVLAWIVLLKKAAAPIRV
jgi:hypothetical protein